MSGGDGDAALSLFRGFVDSTVFEECSHALFSLTFSDCSG
jgi:hypothetical protein